jgi:hypothetical protein
MNDPFDRGEIGESSLAATERLRARLMSQQGQSAPPPRRSAVPWAMAAALAAFAAGLIANPWFEDKVRGRLPFLPAGAVDAPAVTALEARLKALEAKAPSPPVVAAERLARTEARVESSTDQIQRDAERIDELTAEVARLTARLAAEEARTAGVVATAQGAADRAEAMLTVLLMRRAVADGRPLDALLPATRRLFEARNADEVATLAALSAAPATHAGLQRELASLGVALPAGSRPNWWQAFTGRIDALVSGSPGAGALERAQAAGARGDLVAAAVALRADPALARDPRVRSWLAAAGRLRAAETALGVLEAQAAVPLTAPVAASVPATMPSARGKGR